MRRTRLAAVLAVALAGAGCAAASRQVAWAPDDLRRELSRRIPADEVVVPFELSAEHARRARLLVAYTPSASEKVRILVDALFSPHLFGLRYRVGVPGTAEDAFRNGGGDCLALASAFVGLARAAGLDAGYMDASFHLQQTEYLNDQTTVKIGHITAFVRTIRDRFGLDFGGSGRIYWYQPIDDLEAVAHYYNNLGYLLLEGGGEGGDPAGWAAAAHQFDLATRVQPGFARAWNNLGVAEARLGHREAAVAAYRRAMALDGTLASPRTNLGALLLEAGELDAAGEELEEAARLDPASPNVQYELGLVRWKRGDRAGATRALEKAISLRGEWPAARALLDQLAAEEPAAGGG
ncbi:MAG TPA: tetratricopeptide repeat protein [Anaeromyxobacter sp.]|nr:tetratricopeptide repeat protein [Anaeromyxobacter sp.]